ncbi:hypothetical protein PoB_002711000 [Plakobranchus ocellatus]|uniref:BHLH domain-containing protein n=1 Tax=Plakobranchus ocellatus TaxID=259542 RepID=A0AAV3ZZI2_9GAST|nr:hypothetical protein PoB_002711000 [Plakobranchus ocellatus]
MMDRLNLHAHTGVVWSASCQTTGGLRRYLEEKHIGEAPKIPRRKMPKFYRRPSCQHSKPQVFSGTIVAPPGFENCERFGSNGSGLKRPGLKSGASARIQNVQPQTKSRSGKESSYEENWSRKNGVHIPFPQPQFQNNSAFLGNRTDTRCDPMVTDPENHLSKRAPPRGRSAPLARSHLTSTLNPSPDQQTSPSNALGLRKDTPLPITMTSYGDHPRDHKADNLTTSNEEDNKTKPKLFARKTWHNAFEKIINNPEKSESSAAHEHILAKCISIPTKFTLQEQAARFVTVMKSSAAHFSAALTSADGRLPDRPMSTGPNSPIQPMIRAQSAPPLAHRNSRREMQRRFSTEAWYQKALPMLRAIPAYMPKVDEGPCSDLEEIAKRLSRTTAATRAREAATNKVVCREPDSREIIHIRTEHSSKPNRKLVTADMINNMLRFKGQRQVPGSNMQEIVERLSSCEPNKIPDARRIVPAENQHQVGIMNTLSWKGKDPLQREGVNTAGLEAFLQRVNVK